MVRDKPIRARATIYAVSERVVLGIGRLIAIIVVVKYTGVDGQGVYATITSVWSIVAVVVSLGLEVANNFFSARLSIRNISRLVGNNLVHSLLGWVVGTAIVLVVYDHTSILSILPPNEALLISLGLLATLASILFGPILYGLNQFGHKSVAAVVQYTVFIVGTALCWWMWRVDIVVILWMWVASVFIRVVYIIAIVLIVSGYKVKVSGRLLLGQWQYGGRVIGYNLMNSANFRLDQIVLAALSNNPIAVGVYSIAATSTEAILYLPKALKNIVLSDVSRLGRLRKGVFGSVSTILALAVISFALMLPVALPIVFGDGGRQSLIPALVLLPGTWAIGMSFIGSHALFGLNRQRTATLAAFVSLLIGLTLSILLIPSYGAVGAATAASIGYSCSAIVVFIGIARLVDESLWAIIRPKSIRELVRSVRSQSGL